MSKIQSVEIIKSQMWTKDEYYNFIVSTVLDNQYEINNIETLITYKINTK